VERARRGDTGEWALAFEREMFPTDHDAVTNVERGDD
jgi:hypothetical protein